MTGDAWFRPKRYGYGASPANWKGWAFLGAMIVLLWAMIYALVPGQMTAFTVGLVVWLAVVFAVTIGKSSGRWLWRWGSGAAGADGKGSD
jgi:hypothetical protein